MALNGLEPLSERRQLQMLLLLLSRRSHGLEVKVSVGASQHGASWELEGYFFVVVGVVVIVVVGADVVDVFVAVKVVGLDVGGLDP